MTHTTLDMKLLFFGGLACLLLCAAAPCIFAQDNPFGGGQDDPFGPAVDDPQAQAKEGQLGPAAPGKVPEIGLSLPESTRLIIRAVLESDPSTPAELAKSIRTMIDIEAWPHANYFLRKVIWLQPNDEQMYELQVLVGPDFFLALHGNPNMQPEGREFSKAVFAASQRAAYNPARFEKLIKTLSNENLSIRSEAFRSLRRLGAPAAARLIDVFADPKRETEYPYIRGALRKFGDDAISPLVGAVRADNLQVVVEAVRALGAYKSSDASNAMLGAYLSPKFPESVRRSALDTMMTKYGAAADPQEAERQLFQSAEDLLTGRRRLSGDESDLVTMWRWNPDSKQLEPHVVTSITAARITAADRAADLFEIQPNSVQNRELHLLTQLESSKRLAGPSRTINVKQTLARLGQFDELEVQDALARALELDLVPAAIGACEILEEIGSPQVLMTGDNGLSPLVDAMLSGNRHLQYAAFKAIDSIDPKTAFPGSSYVTTLAAYFAASQGRAAGLVGHNRIGTAQSIAAALGQIGVYGQATGSSRDLFKAANTNPDFEVIFIADSLQRPDFIELVQQLRNDWRTREIPIGVLVRSDSVGRRVGRVLRNDPNLLVLPGATDPTTIGSHVMRLRELAKPWPVSEGDRRLHALAAVRWLAKVASDRESYRFWDLGAYQNELANLMYVPGFAAEATKILSGLGTPLAQRRLLEFVSRNGLPMADRQRAADAFIQLVERSGNLLTSDEIRLQYDRYNASEKEPKPTQQLLGRVLDAIEARRVSSND